MVYQVVRLWLPGVLLLVLSQATIAARWPEPGHFAPWFDEGRPLGPDTPAAGAWIDGVGEKWLKGYTSIDDDAFREGISAQVALLESWPTLTPRAQQLSRSVYCSALLQVARLGDAFDCAKTLERDLFNRYKSYEIRKPIELPGWSTPSSSFAQGFLTLFEIYAEYYLAIGDAVSAEHYAARACGIYERFRFSLWNSGAISSPLELRCLQLIGVSRAAQGDLGGAREMLARIEKEYKDIGGFRRGEFEDIYIERKLALLFALEDWQSAGDVLASYAPGARATKNLKRSFVANLLVGVVGTVALSPDAFIGLVNTVAVTPSFSRILERVRREAVLVAKFRQAKVAFELGDHTVASQLYDELIASRDLILLPQILQVSIHADRAVLHERMGDVKSAIGRYFVAIDLIESQRASLNTEAARIGFLGNRHQAYEPLVRLLLATGNVAGAFEVVERAKARALVELLAQKAEIKGGADPSAATMYLSATASAAQPDWTVAPETVRQTRGVMLAEREKLALANPALASIIIGTVPPAEDIRSGLNEELVEYYEAEGAWYAFIVTSEDISVVTIDGTGLHEAVRDFRSAVSEPGLNAEPGARLLYERLVAPLNLIGPSITIVPHGILHYIPFAALRSADGWFGEAIQLRVLPSASVLTYLSPRTQKAPGTLLALGNPDLGDPALALPGAETEVRAVEKLIAGTTALFGKAATESALVSMAPNYAAIHIASHGLFDPVNPVASRLLLAPDAGADGNLTLLELYDLKLNADLITLSACETGLADVAAGDELVGLTRGFLYAGARTIIASWWQVDDAATALMMQTFYKLQSELGPRAALARAQAVVREQYPHPYYWSAFQVVGEG